MKRLAAIALLGALLAACGYKAVDVKHIAPTNYRDQIALMLAHALPDPVGIRDATVGDPMRIGEGPYYVCLRYRMRGSQPKEQAAFFFNGQVNQLVDATPELCGKAAYKPYPELEKLCQGTKCV